MCLSDLIAVSGVSGRWLHSSFQQFRNTTPMNYLKNHRLAKARAMLCANAGRQLTVTEVALNCGFTHLSRFAHDYLNSFGEHPSATSTRQSACRATMCRSLEIRVVSGS